MTKGEIENIFYLFLVRHDAKDIFEEEINRQRPSVDWIDEDPYYWVDCGFNWTTSYYGFQYWQDLEEDWWSELLKNGVLYDG